MRKAGLVPMLLAAVAAGAQAPETLRLGLDEAVAMATAASPRLGRLAALEAAAGARVRGARAERWPQIDLGAGYTRRSEVPELSIPTASGARVVVFPNIQDNWRLRAGLSLPLWTGGRVAAQIAAAEQARVAAGADGRAGLADLVLETKSGYWALVTARQAVGVLQDALRAYDAHLQDAANRERFGIAARNEVLAVQVERDRVELEQLRSEAVAELAEADLRRLLGAPPATRIEPSEALEAPAPAAHELEELVARALAARPERKALEARLAAAEAVVGAERGARRPQLGLSGGLSYANPNRDVVPPTADWKDTWDLGVGVSYNLFDGGRRSAGESRARAQADAVREQLRELDRALRLEVSERSLALRAAQARVAVAERSLLSAAENRRVASERHRAGVIPSSERLDAEVAHERASLARTEALAALRLTAAGLERAVGR